MRALIKSWFVEEQKASRQQFDGKTTSTRFEGLNRSRRNQAKLLLLAALPVLAVGSLVPKWSDASVFERALMALSGSWAFVVMVGGLYFAMRATLRRGTEGNG
jgi:hypothetical protein